MHSDWDLHDAVHIFLKHGADIGSLFCHVDPSPASVAADFHDDLAVLRKKCCVSTVRELLDLRPSTVARNIEIPVARLLSYRLIARWSLISTSQWYRLMLVQQGWTGEGVDKLSDKVAQLVGEIVKFGREDGPIQIVVQMADAIPPEALRNVSRVERIDRLRKHATESGIREVRGRKWVD